MARSVNGKRIGRPPKPVSAEKARSVIEALASGTTLTQYCATKGNPSMATIAEWRWKDPDFAEQFARAREAQAHLEVDQALAIADAATPEDVAVAKLRVDTRLKRAACFCPALFGTRQQAEGIGAITITVVTGVPQPDASAPRRLTVTAATPPQLGGGLDDDDA